MIDDTNDGGIDGREFATQRLTRGAAFQNCNHKFSATGANRIDRQQYGAGLGADGSLRLKDEELRTFELRSLLGGDDLADHSRQDHECCPDERPAPPVVASASGSSIVDQWSTIPTIPASAGTSSG